MIILLLGILLFVMVGVPVFTTGFAFLWYFGKFVLWAVKAIVLTLFSWWKMFWEEMDRTLKENKPVKKEKKVKVKKERPKRFNSKKFKIKRVKENKPRRSWFNKRKPQEG